MYMSNDFAETLYFCFIMLVIFILPIILTGANIAYLIILPRNKKEEIRIKNFAAATIIIGGIDTLLYLAFMDVTEQDWYVQLVNQERHTPIATEHFLTIVVFLIIALAGYILLTFWNIRKIPPLVSVFLIAAVYMGVIISVFWTIQTSDPILAIYPFDLCLMAAGLIRRKIIEYKNTDGERLRNKKLGRLDEKLSDSTKWPFYAFILLWPLMGIVICILLLFGQNPASIIKAWTETSDWTLSMQQAPPNLSLDGHYLCTVAAGGHKKTVKPLREGQRHGHRVIVNRQLCIANAFEQVLEEKTPHFHKAVRSFYDKYGLPVARLIKKPLAADIVYFIMKPLEWLFLIVLYLTDKDPEKRIAVQYLPQKDREDLLKYIEDIQ